MLGNPERHQFIGMKTYIADVDPLHDFLDDDGLFAEVYGSDELVDLRSTQQTIQSVIRTHAGRAFLLLCASQYRKGLFNHHDPRLEDLCTTDEDRRLVLPNGIEEKFNRRISKPGNSLLSDEGFLNELRTGDIQNLWLMGVTTTSCIAQTVHECRERLPKLNLIVTNDTVASRKARRKDQRVILAKWSHESVENLFVFDSWQDVKIVQES